MSTTKEVLNHHLEAFGKGDLPGLLADYTEDSVVITNAGTHRGLQAISSLLEGLIKEFGQAGSEFAMDQQEVEGDVAFITWHGQTPNNQYNFCTDTFVVKDGRIASQTFAGQIEAL